MNKEVIMPALGMAQQTGILTRWLKREGESVVKGEPLMEIETDKVTVEIEATADGILSDVTAAEGDEIPIGQVIGLIVAAGEAGKRPPPPIASPKAATAPVATAPMLPSAHKASPVAARMAREHGVDLHDVAHDVAHNVAAERPRITKADVRKHLDRETPLPARLLPASPKARRLAGESALDPADVVATGPGGAMVAADVRAALAGRAARQAPRPAAVPEGQPLALSRGWGTMARRMVESWHGAPHFFVLRDVDAARLQEWRRAAQATTPEKITYTDLLTKAVAVALRKHPRLNARRNEDTVILNPEINICLAVATSDGLITPVIRAADSLGIGQIAERRRELVEKARTNRLQPVDVGGGTFTISNLGMYNVDAFTAIINPPQAAILAVGRLTDRVVPVDGLPGVRPQMTMTLSCDHRIVDGAGAAAFLDDLAALIQEPLGLIG